LSLLTITAYGAIGVGSVFAEEDPVISVLVNGSNYVGGSGWYAGYVVLGASGTYMLEISANGPERLFPVTNVKVIAVVSDEAAAGGLKSLSINGMPITGYTQTSNPPPYYVAQGGPFQEPDYYGYNDTYAIPQLTYPEDAWPNGAKEVPVTIEFASTATQNSKVMFLCFGIDSAGKPAETPFSKGTMFVIPFIPSTIIGLGAMVGVLGLFYFRKGRTKRLEV